MHAEDSGDLHQRRDAGVAGACLDLLIAGPGYAGREEDLLLGEVESYAADADAVADGAALCEEPGVVIRQGRHSTNALTKIIASQPGLPGIM